MYVDIKLNDSECFRVWRDFSSLDCDYCQMTETLASFYFNFKPLSLNKSLGVHATTALDAGYSIYLFFASLAVFLLTSVTSLPLALQMGMT